MGESCGGIRLRLEESDADRTDIRSVNAAAFGQSDEADLVDRLRSDGFALLSLVAESDAGIVGHILFSRMWIRTGEDLIAAVALAPVAVLPRWQRKGIGGRLIEQGLEQLKQQNEGIVIVLGHPGYYPKFGFSSQKAARIRSPFPPEAFMATELRPGALDGIDGEAVYPAAFGV